MDLLKKTGTILLKIVIGLISLVLLYFLIALISTLIPVNSDYQKLTEGTEIWISSNGVHTNIIEHVSAKTYTWEKFLKPENGCEYLAFGWGDEDFYMNTPTWADIKLGVALKAAFWPTNAVIQIYYVPYEPILSKNIVKLYLTNAQIKKLNDYIYNTFSLDSTQMPIELIPEKEPGNDYKYYKAKGKYSLLFTCNNWTSRGLKKAGIKNALWAPFDKSVLYYLK
jgi:uncharacterized protein (TIGR02117 family)